MAFTFKFPDVGEGMAEGEIVDWLVAEGDEVGRGRLSCRKSKTINQLKN